MTSNRLQLGNRKLPKTTGIWNLPSQETCPMSTEECRKYCYARKAERLYPQVLPFRKSNYLLTLDSNKFIETISEEILKRNIKTIRIHESGDFYSQAYLDSWITISKLFPDVIFYSYTKSRHLFFHPKPINFIVILSDDKEEFTIDWNRFDGVAKVVDNKTYIKTKSDWFECVNDCKICSYCYDINIKNKKIIFKKH